VGTGPRASNAFAIQAMLEALDSELGRLLDSLPASVLSKTTIIFIGDNGTPTEVTAPPFNPAHAKFSIYQGGIRVPFLISGANVVKPNRQSTALVTATDLFATVLRLAGIHDPSMFIAPDVEIDSVSLWPIIRHTRRNVRRYAFSEQFHPTPQPEDGQTIRNLRGFKLLRFPNRPSNTLEFYDLRTDPFETINLYDEANPVLDAEQQKNFDELRARLSALLGL
jgi:arylsulfatase A-like enzyme